MEFKWGEEIATDRKRPDWLRVDDIFRYRTRSRAKFTTVKPPYARFNDSLQWLYISSIVLPADHPYYVATSQGFTYWPGGKNAPDDWDGGTVLFRSGGITVSSPASWTHPWASYIDEVEAAADVIGYKKRVETIAEPLPARWAEKRMLEECGGCIEGPNPIATAFARYIEQHESAPVDPDVLAVREILAAYTLHFDESYVTEDIYKAGEGDGQTWFLAVLEVYRTIKANGGVVK